MHGPTSGSPLPHLPKTGELWWVGAAAEWTEVLCNTMGVLAEWLFGAEKQSLACPSLCSNFDKNMFLITWSQRRICPWEWQKLQLEEGSDRIRGRTKRSGFHLCAVALSGLKYKKQFCYGSFLECPWQKLTEAYGLLWRNPLCFKQIVLANLWQYLSSPIPHSDLASWHHRPSGFLLSTAQRQSVTHKTTACLESSNSDLPLKIPSSFSMKIQVYDTPVFIFHSCSVLITSSPKIFTLLWVYFGEKTISQPQPKSEAITKHQATSVSELRRERNCINKQLCYFFKSKCQVSKAFLMVPNQAEILQPLWISKRSQDGIVCVSWVCANVLFKRCKISFLLCPWTSRSFHSLYARCRYMRHLILYFILFLPIITIRNLAGTRKNPHVK